MRLTGGHRAAEGGGARRRFVLSDHASGRSQAPADLGAAHSTAHASRWGRQAAQEEGSHAGSDAGWALAGSRQDSPTEWTWVREK